MPTSRGARACVSGALLIVLSVTFGALPAGAQQRDTTVVAGPQYSKGGLYRLYFGNDYRDLWTAPVRVQLLDLRTFAGGLTPTTAGGGFQTKSLRFRGADGFQYSFRSVDKDMDVLPPEWEGSVVEDIVQDQTSAAHPGAPPVVAALMEAAGIPHTEPRLVVLPDDAALGEHRERFAGTVGYIERRAITEPGVPGFAGADEIIDGDDVMERVQRSARDRVAARALLDARLLDLLIGDWDRHRGQWGWARFGEEPVTHWVPIPEDRDQALVRFDGVGLWLGRNYAPQLVKFGPKYSSTLGLSFNARELDRRFLVGLERPAWDSAAAQLKWRLTDSVIEDAVSRMAPEYVAIGGEWLAQALKQRRDELPQAADRLYRLLAGDVDIQGTDEAEEILIQRHANDTVEVTIQSGRQRLPYLHRRFDTRETSELRFYLHGGEDRVIVTGPGRGVTLRVIGSGNDVVIDSSDAGGVRFYATGDDEASGPTNVKVDRRPYTPPPLGPRDRMHPPDWGHRWQGLGWIGAGPDLGFFFGGGAFVTTNGFRRHPYASKVQFRAGFSTGATTGRFDFQSDITWSNSNVHMELYGLLSGIETLRFYGFGNDFAINDSLDDANFYRVNQRQITVAPVLFLPFGSRNVELGVGPIMNYFDTKEDTTRIIRSDTLYGSGTLGEVGVIGGLRIDTRDLPSWPTRGFHVLLTGELYPEVWDVATIYGVLEGVASTYLTARSLPFRPTLALRAGARKVFGDSIPFQHAAYIGDDRTVRLGRQNRFGGDAAVWGNAELRFNAQRFMLLLPGQFGLFALGDLGRVFLDGEESDTDTWHWAAGGGVWLSFVAQRMTLSVAVAASDERTAVYFRTGFAY
jgi:hypothetical protein